MTKQQYIYHYDLIYKAEKKTFETNDSFKIMKKAAKACYKFILKNLTTEKILVLCGPGNNGGDGVLIAQYLHKNNFVADIYYPFGHPKTIDSKKALDLLLNKESIKENILFDAYDLIIDALFGTGFNRVLDSTSVSLFNKINDLSIQVRPFFCIILPTLVIFILLFFAKLLILEEFLEFDVNKIS